MKLRNKQTGEIGLVHCDATMFSNKIGVFIDNNFIDLRNPYKVYNSLAELNAEWEDYEEPKEHYFISNCGEAKAEKGHSLHRDQRIKIGNDFKSKEETESVIDKLKAWKRLKDKGFKFNNWDLDADDEDVNVLLSSDTYKGDKVYDFEKDLDICFGGEE